MFATGSVNLPMMPHRRRTTSKPLLDEVDVILDMAEQVLDGNAIDLDPVPIAPTGVNVVDSIPLSRINMDMHDDQKLLDLLSPMTNKRKAQGFESSPTDCCESNALLPPTSTSSCTSSNFLVSNDYDSSPSKRARRIRPHTKGNSRFRPYQSEVWGERLKELCDFREKFGHCLVPHNWTGNTCLAQWVKRQRYQYKLKVEGRHSTLSDERLVMLEKMGFVWDSHRAAWEERLNELLDFRKMHSHCNVPSTYDKIPALAIWVKCQRRQHKLFVRGEKSTMTEERIAQLEALGFSWNPRKL